MGIGGGICPRLLAYGCPDWYTGMRWYCFCQSHSRVSVQKHILALLLCTPVLYLVHRRRGGRAHAQVTRSGHCISVAVGLSVGLSVGLAVNNWGAPIVVVQPRERGGLVLEARRS
eukprot:551353-Rhodomonas_salina.1